MSRLLAIAAVLFCCFLKLCQKAPVLSCWISALENVLVVSFITKL